MAAIEGRELSLQTEDQVVYFEEGKKMRVSYNPRLVGLTREVRMLSVLGFAIPRKIQVTTDLAKQFARQAKELEQVCFITQSHALSHTYEQYTRRPTC